MRQILAMGAFAGAFLAAVGSVVNWNDDLTTTRLALHPRGHAAVAAVQPSPSPAQVAVPSPQPSPSPPAGPAAVRPVALAAPAPARAPAPKPPSVVVGSYQQTLINRDRAAAGLPPVTWSPCLAGVAQQQADRMAASGSIAHTDGISEDLSCGLGGFAGENLGYWTGGINDTQLNSMFMASSEHRANILGNFRYVGTYWAVAPNGTAYLAVEFES
jgi:uncharacterized protein YkwD